MRSFMLVLKLLAATVAYWAIVMVAKGIIICGVDNFLAYRPRVDVVTFLLHLWLCSCIIRSHKKKYASATSVKK